MSAWFLVVVSTESWCLSLESVACRCRCVRFDWFVACRRWPCRVADHHRNDDSTSTCWQSIVYVVYTSCVERVCCRRYFCDCPYVDRDGILHALVLSIVITFYVMYYCARPFMNTNFILFYRCVRVTVNSSNSGLTKVVNNGIDFFSIVKEPWHKRIRAGSLSQSPW